MTTTTAPAMTPKQKQVRDLLANGLKPPEIAKRLKISTSGVYGHVRNMRAAGIPLPDEAGSMAASLAPEPAAAPPAAANGNGALDPAAALSAAIEQVEARLAEIASEQEALEQHASELSAEAAQLQDGVGKYRAALEALA